MTNEPVTRIDAEMLSIEAAISENVNTLLHRSRMSATALAGAIGMSKATLSRKMLVGPWHYTDVSRIARFYAVDPAEIAGTLPSAAAWADRWAETEAALEVELREPQKRARRDSNPKPSDP